MMRLHSRLAPAVFALFALGVWVGHAVVHATEGARTDHCALCVTASVSTTTPDPGPPIDAFIPERTAAIHILSDVSPAQPGQPGVFRLRGPPSPPALS